MSSIKLWRSVSILLLTLGIARIAHAQDKQFYWERLDVQMTILTNSDIQVVETQELVFGEGTFAKGSRSIPMNRLEAIADVEVWEGDRPYTPNSDRPYGFTTSVEGGDFYIRWYFPETSGRHTYTLKYTVKGGLRFYEVGDQLWWKAVFPDRRLPVHSSRVTVNLPAGIEPSRLKIDSFGAPGTYNMSESRQIVFSVNDIQPGQEVEVRITFPHGIVQGAKPGWQTAEEQGRTSSRPATYVSPEDQFKLIAVPIFGVVVIIAIVVALVRASRRGWSATGSGGWHSSSSADWSGGGWDGGGGGGDSGGGGDGGGGGGGDFG